MSADWLNKTDEGLRVQAEQFSGYVSANTVAIGLVAGDATTLASNVTAYQDKLAVSSNDSTRTPVAIAEKDTAKAVLIANLRSLGRRLQANPNLSDAQRVALTLPVRDTNPTPSQPLVTRPVVSIIGVAATDVAARAHDELTPNSRKKPPGAIGLQYFSWVGPATPPLDLERWRFEGVASRSQFVMGFHLEDAGKPITVVARWFNRKGEVGPASFPVTTALAVPAPLAA
jgi:hypothetical protein